MPEFRPLRGVRVVAFEAAFSLPAGTRTLAELGAEIIRIGRPERVSGDYINVVDGNAFSKLSLGVNLQHPEGQAIARQLVAKADVVCNNFRPRVLARFGLDEPSLRQLKPDLIVLQLSGYGTPGPWSDYPAYGPSVEAAGGMNALSGHETDAPVRVGSGVFADQAGGRYAALALIAALEHRRRTGEGQYIDLSMYEGIVHLLGDALLSTARRSRRPARRGNRDALDAPQGIYPCQGEDEWVALTVKTDAQWRALRDLIALPGLADPSLDSAAGRRARHDEIDAAIITWTRTRTKFEAAEALQAAGIAAGAVQKPRDVAVDPLLAARGGFSSIRHAAPLLDAAAHPHLTTPWTAAGYRRHALRDTAGDGADNTLALRRWLGLKPRQVAKLEDDGALIRFRPFRMATPPVPKGTPVDREFANRLGLERSAPATSNGQTNGKANGTAAAPSAEIPTAATSPAAAPAGGAA